MPWSSTRFPLCSLAIVGSSIFLHVVHISLEVLFLYSTHSLLGLHLWFQSHPQNLGFPLFAQVNLSTIYGQFNTTVQTGTQHLTHHPFHIWFSTAHSSPDGCAHPFTNFPFPSFNLLPVLWRPFPFFRNQFSNKSNTFTHGIFQLSHGASYLNGYSIIGLVRARPPQ